MHQYLKAIGFDNIHTRKELRQLLREVEERFTHQTIVSYRPGEDFCEYQKEYGQFMGITVCGELDEEDNFDPAYYFPYFEGSGVTTYADISVERKIEKEQYVGMCEDSKIGISLIFTLRNGIDYMREKQAGFTVGPDDFGDVFRTCTVRHDPSPCCEKRETEKERAGGRRQQADASECREKRRSDGNRDADTG